ncbi:DUF2721 domain-containing protein [Rhodocaloribacter litoris]|uniref:DUF2721 domain-containing protein n=1 Tax=Rhodocaloribacter litoris TaxID=2558931 RepID=UPI0014221C7D|nr:DUF2721 domain-containing protein [Rhodocaloribacter litoris]QXD15462.1 DUF2721 domain-containing protein [Rhodocaloribacter litoris]
MSLSDLVATLQLAIGPVILISGVGLLLLSMTNRFGRVIDRARLLRQDLLLGAGADQRQVHAQLRILWQRARIVRAAIALAAVSVLLAALLVITLFVGALLGLAVTVALVGLFVLCLAALIAALVLFIVDINVSLKALGLEIPPEDRLSR